MAWDQIPFLDEEKGEYEEIAAGIKPVSDKLSASEQEIIVKYIMGVKNNSEQYYSGRRTKWLDYFHHYINKKRTNTRSTIPVPLATEHVDITLADMVSRQFATSPFCSVKGKNLDDKKRAPAIESLIQYQYEQMGIFDIYYRVVKSALIYGSGIYRICYDIDYLDVPIPNSDDRRIMRYAGPNITVYDIFDYFPDSSKVDVNDAAPSVVRMYRPYEYLEERSDTYDGVYFDVHKIPHKRSVATDNDDMDARQERQIALGMSPEGTERGLIEIYEGDLWWPVQMKDGTYVKRPYIGTIANGKLIRFSRNPYISQDGNMGLAVIDRIPNDLFGLGLIEKMHPNIHGANTILDMMLTNLELNVNRKKIINTEQVTREHEINNRSGGVVHSRGDVNTAMRWEDPGMIVPDAYNIMGMFVSGAESASGVKPAKKGISNERTATATLRAGEEAGKIFNLYMLMIENTLVKHATSRMHKINQQFLELPMVIPVLGKNDSQKWAEINYDTIALDADFIPEGSQRMADQQMNIAQIEKFLMIISKIPAMYSVIPIIIGKLAREFRWQEADEIERVTNMAMEQFMIMSQMTQGAEGGAPAGPGMNQIADHGNSAGVNATNSGDLNQALGAEFGPSAFN